MIARDENGRHTPQFRAFAVKKALSSGNVRRTCQELNVASSVMYRWLGAHRANGGEIQI